MKRSNFKKLLATVLVLAQVLCLGAVFAMGTSAAAPTTMNRSYTFYKADASMLDANGKFIKADAWANIPWSEDLHCFETKDSSITDGKADPNFGGKFQGMWADGYLYYHVVIYDTTPTLATGWTKDGFIFSISETGQAVKYADGTACRKTDTRPSVTGTGSKEGFEYSANRDDEHGIIDIQVRYTFHDANNAKAGNTILLDVMVQNNLAASGDLYQKNGWNDTKTKNYNTKVSGQNGAWYLGTGLLSPVSALNATPVKYNGNIIGLTQNAAAEPALLTTKTEAITYNVYNSATNIRVEGATYTDKYLVKSEVASGALTYVDNALNLSMVDGAAVRVKTPAGLRFESRINKAAYDAMVAANPGKTVTVGTLILPTDLLASNAFTKEALTKAGVPYLDVVNNGWANAAKAETDGYYQFYASIVGIKTGNYTRNFSAVSYITIDGVTVYSVYNAEKNSRNVTDVAQAAITAGDYQNDAELNVLKSFVPSV